MLPERLFHITVEEPAGAGEDGAEHRLGEFAGGGVLLAGMEGAKEDWL